MTNPTNKIVAEIDHVAASLSAAREEASKLGAHIAELEQRVRLARGTREGMRPLTPPRGVSAVVLPQPAPPKPDTVAQRVERALTASVMSVEEIADASNTSPVRVTTAIRSLGDKVRNVGTERRPRYTWVVGPDAPIELLAAAVSAVLRERPMTRQEIEDVTGASDNRVGGALRRIQRDGGVVENLGTRTIARWYVRSAPQLSRGGAVEIVDESDLPAVDD